MELTPSGSLKDLEIIFSILYTFAMGVKSWEIRDENEFEIGREIGLEIRRMKCD